MLSFRNFSLFSGGGGTQTLKSIVLENNGASSVVHSFGIPFVPAMDIDFLGGTPVFSMWGVYVNVWGLRFSKKIKFGLCELQLKKSSTFGV